MEEQLKWLNELLNKEPKRFEEYFYFDILNSFNLDFEENEINKLYNICGSYTDELLKCKRKKDVEKWLLRISNYVISKLDVEVIVDEFFYNFKKGETDI